MPNLNRVFLLGRVVKDPELRYTPKQTAVAELGLAINRVTTDPEGQKHEEVTFVDITLWARQAEKEVPSSSKGVSNWTLGTTGSPVRNVGEHLRLLGSRQDSEAAALWADSSSSA
jgi:single-strand DNA-binding protein